MRMGGALAPPRTQSTAYEIFYPEMYVKMAGVESRVALRATRSSYSTTPYPSALLSGLGSRAPVSAEVSRVCRVTPLASRGPHT